MSSVPGDSRRPFFISFDDRREIFRAHALDESGTRWNLVEVSRDFNELFSKCTERGMSYDGADFDALPQTLNRSI